MKRRGRGEFSRCQVPHPRRRDRRAGPPGAGTPGTSSPLGGPEMPEFRKGKSPKDPHAFPSPRGLQAGPAPSQGGSRCGGGLTSQAHPLPRLEGRTGHRKLSRRAPGQEAGGPPRGQIHLSTPRYGNERKQPLHDLEKYFLANKQELIVFTQLAGAS